MSYPCVTLGGVPIELHSGAPAQNYETIGGSSTVRLHEGAAVKLSHWRRARITISGTGWMSPGLAGLDYDNTLELRCTKQQAITSVANIITLSGRARPDVAPWALALVGSEWVSTPCVVLDGVATLTPVAGAALYQVCWMPVFQVFAEPPPETAEGGNFSWSIVAEEV